MATSDQGDEHDEHPLLRVPAVGDVALAGGLLGVAVLSGLFVDAGRPDTVEPNEWWHWTLISLPPLLVAVRRLHPVAVVALATVAQAAVWISDLPEVLLPIVVIMFTSASEAGRPGLRAALVATSVLTVVTAVGVAIADDVSPYQLPLVVLTCGTAIWLGTQSAQQRRRAGELAEAVAETRLRGEHDRRQAVATERTYIARELHDIIGHTLSVIAVRAEAADRIGSRQPQAAAGAVAAIAEASRTALDETRRVLAGLPRSGPAELAPPPDLAAVSGLVADLATEGVDVTLTETGCDANPPPATVAGGAYRIVQESLTNAVKHGGAGAPITVDLRCDQARLTIRIVNGIGAPPRTVPAGDQAPGSGITAMTERAEVLGGRLSATNEGDRFVVQAELPLGVTRPTADNAPQPRGAS